MIQITVFDFVLTISHVDNMAEVLKVKRLPGRVYDEINNLWVVPIRPGLADALEAAYGVTVAEPVLVRENYFMRLIEPPPPGSINMDEVSAAHAVELAVLYRLYHAHGGDVKKYHSLYYPYKIGE